MKFKDIKIGDKFECYGDKHLNYDYPKICICIKTGENNAQELHGENIYGKVVYHKGTSFLMNKDDDIMQLQ